MKPVTPETVCEECGKKLDYGRHCPGGCADIRVTPETEKRGETPELYEAYTVLDGRHHPCVRLDNDRGTELAVITLSGYKMGEERSPAEWAALIVKAVNQYLKSSPSRERGGG